MGLRCGIDLGTTYSAISWYDDLNNRVVTVHLNMIADGQTVVPSVVYFPGPDKEPIVGKVACNAEKQHPDRVVRAIKRQMGADYRFGPVDGRSYTPQEVSAEILKALVKEAETELGQPVTDVVITVPAWFGDNECQATKEAGELAGLNVLTVMPEPHAAALAYSVNKAEDAVQDQTVDIHGKHLLVYDLGGGTFDVTLIHATSTKTGENTLDLKITTLCKDGNARRGGIDWDEALAELVDDRIKTEHDVSSMDEPRDRAYLLEQCEQAKRHLTMTSPAYVLAMMGQHQAEVTRAEFEDATSNLLQETRMLLEKVLDDAEHDHGVSRDQVVVMLTGGATKMPMVREMIEDVVGRPPLLYGNPELLVSNGAAYQAYLMPTDGSKPDHIYTRRQTPDGDVETIQVTVQEGGLVDTVAYAVGVKVLRPGSDGKMTEHNAVIIPPNSQRGTRFEKTLAKSADKMTTIPIVLYRSDVATDDLSQCTAVATFNIDGLPPDGKKGEEVWVSLMHDASGILCGEAKDVTAGKTVEIRIERPGDVSSALQANDSDGYAEADDADDSTLND